MNRWVLLFAFTAGCVATEIPGEPNCFQGESAQKAVLEKAAPSGENRPRRGKSDKSTHFCVRVVDGDTIVVQHKGNRERVRLLRIDTPERGEAQYEAAKEALKKLVLKKRVRLEFEESGVEARDGYGRLLAYVFVGGVFVNAQMIRQGWSRFETGFGKGRYAEELIAAGR